MDHAYINLDDLLNFLEHLRHEGDNLSLIWEDEKDEFMRSELAEAIAENYSRQRQLRELMNQYK